MIRILKRLLIKFGIIKLKTAEELHKEKLSKIREELAQVRGSLSFILPEELRREFLKYSFISGGCIYSLYNENKPKDFDFFLTSATFAEKLHEYFLSQSGYHGNGICGGVYKDLPLTITDNAISIGKYQIITQWVGQPEDVVEQFDFEHLMHYFRDGKIHSLSNIDSLKSKEIKYNKKRARDIIGTIMRVNKFVSRGMKISYKEMAKILLKLHEVGFSERELKILEDSSSDKHFSS